MLEILNKSLNGILLGTKRNEIGEKILNDPNYFLFRVIKKIKICSILEKKKKNVLKYGGNNFKTQE